MNLINNDMMTDLTEFPAISTMHTVNIIGCDALTQISTYMLFCPGVTSIQTLLIKDNNALASLYGLNNVATIVTFSLLDNP